MQFLLYLRSLRGFYKKHIDHLTDHAADKRRYVVNTEALRHYIDNYGENLFEIIAKKWNDSVDKFSEDTLLAYGIVPCHTKRFITD